MDIFIQYTVGAAELAVEDAGLPLPLAAPERTGVIVGVGMGGISSVEEMYLSLAAHTVRRVSPFLIPRIIPNMASGQIAIRYGARGPNYATTSACASGAHAIGEALMLIRDGRQDVMLAGGAEAPICLLGVGGFSAMRALATNFNDEPARASRPFDARRDGFVIAEGAGVLVLEELEHARRRGARVYAELARYGATSDAYHMTQRAPRAGRGGALQLLRLRRHERGARLPARRHLAPCRPRSSSGGCTSSSARAGWGRRPSRRHSPSPSRAAGGARWRSRWSRGAGSPPFSVGRRTRASTGSTSTGAPPPRGTWASSFP